MYASGPSVYDYGHISNFSTFTFTTLSALHYVILAGQRLGLGAREKRRMRLQLRVSALLRTRPAR